MAFEDDPSADDGPFVSFDVCRDNLADDETPRSSRLRAFLFGLQHPPVAIISDDDDVLVTFESKSVSSRPAR